MATDLRVTPARLALLRGVADGAVYRLMDVDGNLIDFQWLSPGRNTRVTARCAEAEGQGWIVLDGDDGLDVWAWDVTPAGQAVLDAHPAAVQAGRKTEGN